MSRTLYSAPYDPGRGWPRPPRRASASALVCDLYEITMACSYLREGMTAPATFSLFVRDLPADRGFLVAAGVESALDLLTGFRFGPPEVAALARLLRRPESELRPLLGTRFEGDVWAVPEGTIVLAGEPLVEVTAPLPQAQLVETLLLNQVSHQTAVASKAARCVLAARGRTVVDFALRRAHGLEAGEQAARLGALVGYAATSHIGAALEYGIGATGTMAHSYVEAFASEEEAFRAFARAWPGPIALLVDTYDTVAGLATAARVLGELREREGPGARPGCGVRLDSGDLGEWAVTARRMLNEAGLGDVRIIASGGLDEYAIDDLLGSGAPIDVFAVGTKVGVSADAPYLDSAYKLVSYGGRAVMKLSAAKATAPGAKQIFRHPGFADVIGLRDEPCPPDAVPLLRPLMAGGRRLDVDSAATRLAAARRRFAADLGALPLAARRIRHPLAPAAAVSPALRTLTADVRRRLTRRVAL